VTAQRERVGLIVTVGGQSEQIEFQLRRLQPTHVAFLATKTRECLQQVDSLVRSRGLAAQWSAPHPALRAPLSASSEGKNGGRRPLAPGEPPGPPGPAGAWRRSARAGRMGPLPHPAPPKGILSTLRPTKGAGQEARRHEEPDPVPAGVLARQRRRQRPFSAAML